MSPTLLVLAVVVALPVLAAIWQSMFTEPRIDPVTGFVGTGRMFVGLDNYRAGLLADGGRFWNALANTTAFTLITVTLETSIGFLMALAMHHAARGRGIVRATILIPWAVPTAVAGLLWRWIFDADGAANALLGTRVLWSSDGLAAQAAVIIADTWKTAPFVALLVLAGLQTIPGELYEAAELDGAGPLRRLSAVTLPLVKPALLVAVLFRTLDALRMFDLPYVLIGPRKESVETLSMLVQDEAINLHLGAAAAFAVLLFLYVAAIAFAFVSLLGADVLGDRSRDPVR